MSAAETHDEARDDTRPDPRIDRNKPVIEPAHPPGTIHSFTQLLGAAEDGKLNGRLSQEYQQLMRTMIDHSRMYGGKIKGSITLTLNFSQEKGEMEMTTETKVAAPKEPSGRTHMWPTPQGMITVQNPHQRTLFSDANAGSRHSSYGN